MEKFEYGYKKEDFFEEIEGYLFEKFSSDEEMYSRMEEIRKKNSEEVCGFVVKKEFQIGFYYKIGDSKTSGKFPPNIENSWHSHPDTEITESIFDTNDLPKDFSKEVQQRAEEFIERCNKIDEMSPNKTSLIDLINFVSHKRKKDLISLPNNSLLEICSGEVKKDSLVRQLGDEINNKWLSISEEVALQITDDNFEEIMIVAILQYFEFAVLKFKELIEKNGYKRMDENNFLQILEKIGLPCELKKI